ncbi:MAG: hypothetical protein IJC88_03820 [Oscillospiraceae bacterium]|nr:hypothetical protein [Oscillospiraceae bacterium]
MSNSNVQDATTERKIPLVFEAHNDKEDVAKNIFVELNKRFITITENGRKRKGFCMEDGSRRIGLLSQCHSLQTMVSLAQDFGLDFTDANIIEKQNGTIREMMDAVIEDVLELLYVKNENGDVTGYKFDASPYETDAFNETYSNIDSITWVISSFLLILKHHAHIHEVCKWESVLVDVIKRGLNYINNSFISKKGDGTSLTTGWNFTAECEEPSLYFTFAVCDCYISFYNTFEVFLKYLHAERNKEQLGGVRINEDDEKQRERYKEWEDTYKKNLLEYEEHRDDVVADEKTARHNEYNELIRVFRLINDINDRDEVRIENTLYEKLATNCMTVAKQVWACTKENLAEKFFYNDLKNTVTEQELKMSTTSDVLFNTVYIINIMLSAGLDADLELEREKAKRWGDMETVREKQREYDNLLESCMLAVQRAFRTYESLRNAGKDYIVDQFLIGFNENFDGHKMPISELRKLRMRVFSLVPLLIHTNNTISEYLIKYPHYNMRKYHQYILDNRFVDKNNKVHWIWERDGFFSGSNFYYVLSLKEFYNYHETYEDPYIEIHSKNSEQRKIIEGRYKKDLELPDGAIGKLEIEKNSLERANSAQAAEIKELKQQLENIERPVEDAVRNIVNEEFEKQFALRLSQAFSTTSKVLTLPSVDDTSDIPLPSVQKTTDGDETTSDDKKKRRKKKERTPGIYESINNSLFELIWRSMLARFCDSQIGTTITADEYLAFQEKVKKEFARTVRRYINDICYQSEQISDTENK